MIAAILASTLLQAPTMETWTLTVGETKRTAQVYKPTKKTEGAPPLVLAFHGHGGTHAFAKDSVPGMVAFFRSLL